MILGKLDPTFISFYESLTDDAISFLFFATLTLHVHHLHENNTYFAAEVKSDIMSVFPLFSAHIMIFLSSSAKPICFVEPNLDLFLFRGFGGCQNIKF